VGAKNTQQLDYGVATPNLIGSAQEHGLNQEVGVIQRGFNQHLCGGALELADYSTKS